MYSGVSVPAHRSPYVPEVVPDKMADLFYTHSAGGQQTKSSSDVASMQYTDSLFVNQNTAEKYGRLLSEN